MRNLLATLRGHWFRLRMRCFRRNVAIGPGLKLFCRFVIKGDGQVAIGRDCVVSGIPGNKLQYTTIFTHSPDAVVTIGDDATLCAARISSKFEISIGRRVLLEEACLVDTDFHSISADRRDAVETRDKCRILVGDRVSLGARSIICKGAAVGDDVIVFPGSIVNKGIPAGSVVAGNPARPYRSVAALPEQTAV